MDGLGADGPRTAAREGTRRWPVVPLLAAVAVAAVAGYIFYPRPASALTDKDTIVLAEFTNTTGDPVFDETLRQGLAVQLQQSPFLSLISDERIRRTLALMNQPADARLTPELAQGVCARTGSAAVLEGSIAPLGSQYVLGLRATECTTGDILADEQAQAARKEEVLSTLSEIATRFRTRVGESLATIQKHSMPLEEATTPSLEALKAFSAAMRTHLTSRRLPLLQRAIELDPEFVMAHAHLGFRLQHRWGVGAGAGKPAQGLPASPSHQQPSSASISKRCTTATSPAIWNENYGHLKPGPKAIRAIRMPSDCLRVWRCPAPASTSGRSPRPKRRIAMDPDSAPAYSSLARNLL